MFTEHDMIPLSVKTGVPMSFAKQSLNAEEKDAARVLLTALEPFKAVYSIMPLQQASTFLMVAMEEGLGVGEYARKAGANPGVMTRHMLDLGELNRRHEPGLGLVFTRLNPMNRRMHQCFLTPKGVALATAVYRALAGRKGTTR